MADFAAPAVAASWRGGADSLLLPAESGVHEKSGAPRSGEMASMKWTPKEIVERLQIVDALTTEGWPVAEALRWAGMTEVAYNRWRTEYDGLLRTLGPLRPTLPKKKRRPGPPAAIKPAK